VRRTRAVNRAGRKKARLPTVALVGYTNAGKSTLFNRLSGADVFAKNLLFATLDPTMRSIKLPGGRDCVISDTVGFVSDLPTHLMAAFRATLEEVVEADLIVHVRDIAHPDSERQRADVEEVLTTIGAIDEDNGTPMIEALNKIDELPLDQRRILQARTSVGPERTRQFPVSALSGEGVDQLLQAIEDRLGGQSAAREVTVPLSDGATIAWLYRHGDVRSRQDEGEVARLMVALDAAATAQFERRLAR
jgi:GTP-binding protein HflX